jgi:hypothetical protein
MVKIKKYIVLAIALVNGPSQAGPLLALLLRLPCCRTRHGPLRRHTWLGPVFLAGVPLLEHVDEHLCDLRERAGLRHAVLIQRCDSEEEHVGRAHGEREHPDTAAHPRCIWTYTTKDLGSGRSKVNDGDLWRKKNDDGGNEIRHDELQIPTKNTSMCLTNISYSFVPY